MTFSETQTYRRIDRRAKLRRNPGLYWIREDPGGFAAALTAQKTLGRLPRALRKTHVQFDEDEARTYGGLPGGTLAQLAGRLVLTALDESRCLFVLRGIAEAVLAPLTAYLRVKLALQTLEETITQCCHSGLDPEDREIEMLSTCHPALDAGPPEMGDDSVLPLEVTDKPVVFRDDTAAKPTPSFRWRESPATVYKFKQKTADLGYDPRGTSVYWIERRAAQLRAQWKRHHRPPSTRPPIAKIPKTCTADDRPMRLKDFKPADADYGSIWPPIELPAPPLTNKKSHTQEEPQAKVEGVDGEPPCQQKTNINASTPACHVVNVQPSNAAKPHVQALQVQRTSGRDVAVGAAPAFGRKNTALRLNPNTGHTPKGNRKARRAARKLARLGRAPP